MTLRNRHDRTRDHDGLLDLSDVDVDGTPLLNILGDLASLLSGIGSVGEFTIQATVRRTMQWQVIDGSIRMNAILGNGVPSPLTYARTFTINAVKV